MQLLKLQASGPLEGIMSAINCTVEIVILIVYWVVFCSDFIILQSVTVLNHRRPPFLSFRHAIAVAGFKNVFGII